MSGSADSTTGKKEELTFRQYFYVYLYGALQGLFASGNWNMVAILLPQMMRSLRIDVVMGGAILAAGRYVGYPGNWISAWIAERYGRRLENQYGTVMFMAGLIAMMMATDAISFAIAFSFSQMMRNVETASSALLIVESAPASQRGWMVCLTNLYSLSGVLAGALSAIVIGAGLSWRVAFAMLVLPMLAHLTMGLWVGESERYKEMMQLKKRLKSGEQVTEQALRYAADTDKTKHIQLKQLFYKDMRRLTITIPLAISMVSWFWWNYNGFWTLFFTTKRGMNFQEAAFAYAMLWLISFPGYVFGAFYSQKIGARNTTLLGYAGVAATILPGIYLGYGMWEVIAANAAYQFFIGTCCSPTMRLLYEYAPTRMRATFYAWYGTMGLPLTSWPPIFTAYLFGIIGMETTWIFVSWLPAVIGVGFLLLIPNMPPKAEVEDLHK